MENSQIHLTTKPSAALYISYCPPFPVDTAHPLYDQVLVVFLNGLALPRASWNDAIQHLVATHQATSLPLPALLSYDRFGQGTSDPDPTDPPSTPYGHDALAIVADLHQLLTQLAQDRLHRDLSSLRLVLVGSSIGCPLARLYAAAHPASVAAFLFLDSMMANTDFVSLLPDPDSSSFDEGKLPRDTTVDDVRHARTQFRSFFHPTLPNREGFDRRYLAQQLPLADQPALPAGPGGRDAVLLVVGHDPETFAEQSEVPPFSVRGPITNAFINPAWRTYNEGLCRLVPDGQAELKTAPGCGHFIQKDDPVFVASAISHILRLLTGESDDPQRL